MPVTLRGTVVRTTGSRISVRAEDGALVECVLKGNFRIRGIKTTNPVAVGDHVEFQQNGDTGLITAILDRDNYLVRRATKLSKQSHIIAANVDQVVLIASIAQPRTSTGFIDRVLVTAEAYHIPSIIVINKIDLHSPAEDAAYARLAPIYEDAGYPCLRVSALSGEGIEDLKKRLEGMVSLLTGHSGSGKSTLLNRIEPGLHLKVKEISAYHQKGQHATTFTEMFSLSGGGFVIDTPGIKEFGLIDFEKGEVGERFPEIRRYIHGCRYHNCTHTHEPDCAVKKALQAGKISRSRYDNYLRIFFHEDWDEVERY